MRHPTPSLFSYWSGPVTWMERLSVASAQALGYEVTVFSSDPGSLERAGLGCAIADARPIMGVAALERYRSSPVLMSDHFRLEAIAQGLGTWFDLDVIFLKPLPSDPYLFGLHTQTAVATGILRFPTDSPILSEYLTMCRQRRSAHQLPPWYPWPSRVRRTIRTGLGRLVGKSRPGTMYGPRTLTHLVHKHGLAHLAKPASVFYPIPSNQQAVTTMATKGWPEDAIGPETLCVHLWRSLWTPAQLNQEPAWAPQALTRAAAWT
jgi:hypothetical protein